MTELICEKIEDKRPYTHKQPCPECGQTIEYWWTSGMSECFPHFYCNECGSAIWRIRDQKRIWYLKKENDIKDTIKSILEDLPQCTCGGKFTLEARPICFHCGCKFAEKQTFNNRVFNPNIMLLTGASMMTEND